jgi:acyl-coenzyme A synthetase/AMP-(fatty) acid ligase
VDDEGYLDFVGRVDDVIESRGEILGREVEAVVVLERGAAPTEKEIQRECQTRLENFMVPKYVEFVAELPGTDTGKLEKTGLS